jgi:methylmalonyl-CoA mutase
MLMNQKTREDQIDQSENHRVRFVTAASLFDGHDASINIMRRILQDQGTEVIHLGHDRSVMEIAEAAIQEDVHGIAISSYQGGHMEFFTYLIELLAERGRGDICVFGGGGGTITDREIQTLEARGVSKIFSVEDGRRLGLVGMIEFMIERATAGRVEDDRSESQLIAQLQTPIIDEATWRASIPTLAQVITRLERSAQESRDTSRLIEELTQRSTANVAPILGITGVGGAGKSSLTDELVRRFLRAFPDRRLAVLSVDPTRRRSGGALLGDRIRMNAITSPRVMMRSMATRSQHTSVSPAVRSSLELLSKSGADLVILETAGIGQSGSEVIDLSDLSLYVMTPEFGAPSQLEKIDMLDFADLVALNKSDKRGATDAVRYVAKQVQRNRKDFDTPVSSQPVYGCIASRFGDQGVNMLFEALCAQLDARCGSPERPWTLSDLDVTQSDVMTVVPPHRVRYLSEIADTVRGYHRETDKLCDVASEADGLWRSAYVLMGQSPDQRHIAQTCDALNDQASSQESKTASDVIEAYHQRLGALGDEATTLLSEVPQLRQGYTSDEHSYSVRGREIKVTNYTETLSCNPIPKVSLPRTDDWSTLLRWRRAENIPGQFPFTAGVFPYKRAGEDPTRMFAGEGHPERTNRRFHYLSQGQRAARLSTAFDSVTLYGRDPDLRPDIYGKVGNSGVSVATLDDAKRLYSGFDLCSPTTSVSMTINGPAPMILALFLNTAIDQQVERRLRDTGRWEDIQDQIKTLAPDEPRYRDDLPPGHDGFGLGLLGVSGDQLLDADEYEEIKALALQQVRGTVQADILKEDQAQNTCIFSTDFALKMMGDIQEYFVDKRIRNFYSVSISGYHIAEAGANPISQLAFTLANGFTFVEYYRARGMDPSDFARNLSFFFSNGVDPEYAVIGRVARRIWAIAMRDLYSANTRSQQLKYHIQTSGRSLHAQEIQFNDVRTTLQALYAIMDNCNSLHTNAYDEAITTPTEESVRRALAIQLIINRELGLTKNENPLQGSYFIESLTDLVEEAVLQEFDRITERGGVLGAMEVMYQRGKIQEESMDYEMKKHSGELPIIGVNTFLPKNQSDGVIEVELIRASDEEKHEQLNGLKDFHHRHHDRSAHALHRLQGVALEGGNIFAELMECAKVCSLGQMTEALFEVGGQYRRNV